VEAQNNEPEMVTKVATVLRDGMGFAADTIFRGNGAILKEFQSDTLLADLIKNDMQKYSTLLGNKAQIAVCSGVDVLHGFQKRKISKELSSQNEFEKNVESKK
jgi:hypothetical protein